MANPSDPRPFQPRKQSRAERRASEKRSRERAAAWAAAMPPPDPTQRVDPLSGATAIGDVTAGTPVFSVDRGLTTASPSRVTTPAPSRPPVVTSAPPAPARSARTTASPTPASAGKTRPSRRRGKPAPVSSAGLPSLSAIAARESRPSLGRRISAQWPGQVGRGAFYLGTPAAAVAAMAGAGAGLPVLTGTWDWYWVGGGAVTAAVCALVASRGWASAGPKLRIAVPATVTVLAVAFAVGLASGPVVVDGKVYVSTSSTARSAKLADQIRTDLYTLVAFDDLLAASQADARAAIGRYVPATVELDQMNARYAAMAAGDLPDPSFAGPIEKLKTAAYWGGKAMTVKRELIDQDDAKKSADLDSWRATYASEVLSGGEQLTAVTTELGIPFTLRKEGPHE